MSNERESLFALREKLVGSDGRAGSHRAMEAAEFDAYSENLTRCSCTRAKATSPDSGAGGMPYWQ